MPITFRVQAILVPDFEEGNGDIKDLAISADGGTVAIGSAKTVAQVFVYRRAGTAWSLEATIGAPAGVGDAISPHYALALSEDGSRLVLGDPWAAAASIFARDGEDVWTEAITFFGDEDSRFGQGVAISADGNVVLVGQPGIEDGLGGAALFTYDAATDTYVSAGGFDGQGGPFATGHPKGGYGETVFLADDAETGIATAPGNTFSPDGITTEPWEGSFFSLDGQEIDADDISAVQIAAGAMSGDGNTFLMSAVGDGPSFFVQSWRRADGSWLASDTLEPDGYDELGAFLVPASLSRDGSLAAISNGSGFWIMAYDGAGWVQQGGPFEPPPGTEGYSFFGAALALSADGRTLAVRTAENATVIYTQRPFAVSFDGIEYAG